MVNTSSTSSSLIQAFPSLAIDKPLVKTMEFGSFLEVDYHFHLCLIVIYVYSFSREAAGQSEQQNSFPGFYSDSASSSRTLQSCSADAC